MEEGTEYCWMLVCEPNTNCTLFLKDDTEMMMMCVCDIDVEHLKRVLPIASWTKLDLGGTPTNPCT